MTRTLALVAAFLFLAGCSNAPAAEGDDGQDPVLVTDPTQGRMSAVAGPHLHDYWGSKDEKLVLDMTLEVGGLLTFTDQDIVVAEFRPEPGDVVPQGTSEVRVTLSWTDDDPTNHFSSTSLRVKDAADNAAEDVGELASGDTLIVPTSNEQNDLPHQVLSAWAFQLALGADTSTGVPSTGYSGTVGIEVVAVRGLEIPLYPGHPDRWEGATEIVLIDRQGTLLYDGDPVSGNFRCYGFECPAFIVPDDGAIVPIDADHITVVLERTQPLPTRLGVKLHDASTRDFAVPTDLEQTSLLRTYTIPVGQGGDGPYAKQSQWEFVLFIDEPQDDSWVYEEYSLLVTAYKDP